MALDWRKNYDFVHYLVNELTDFDQILHLLIVTRSELGLEMGKFRSFST